MPLLLIGNTDFTQFRLDDGPKHVAHYGLLLAEVAGLPSPVIETARSITSRITEKVNFHQLETRMISKSYLFCAKHWRQSYLLYDIRLRTDSSYCHSAIQKWYIRFFSCSLLRQTMPLRPNNVLCTWSLDGYGFFFCWSL